MKKSLLALAALTAFAGAASAQSSVTIFGILDVNARSVDNGPAGTLKTESTDGLNSSRLGLRGVEDLGSGLSAAFWLEGQLSPDTGGGLKSSATPNGSTITTQDWSRRSTVSLIGKFGEIRLGRDYVTTFNNAVTADIWNYVGVATISNVRLGSGGVGAASGAALGSGATSSVRTSNMISYFLPSLGGVYGQLSVSAGEGTVTGSGAGTINTPTAGNKTVGGLLGYKAGPLNVGAAYLKTYKQDYTTPPAVTAAMRDDLKTFNGMVTYNFGFATVYGLYEKSTYLSADQKYAMAAVTVPFGASTFKFSYLRSGGNAYDTKGVLQIGRMKDTEIGLGYQYDLSKRTALYASFGRNANGSNAQFTSSSGGNGVGNYFGFTSTG